MSVSEQERHVVRVGSVYIPIVMAGSIFVTVFLAGWWLSQREAEIDKKIDANQQAVQAQIVGLTTIVNNLTKSVQIVADRLDTKTTDRWTTTNQALHCAQMALANAHIGLNCVNPYFTKNEDADVSGIAKWAAEIRTGK